MDIGRINTGMANNTINNDKQKLKKVCQDFESIFLNMMYSQMKATVPKTDLIPGDAGKSIFESMLSDKLIEQASRRGSFGLGETMYKQLSKRFDAVRSPADTGEDQIVEKK